MVTIKDLASKASVRTILVLWAILVIYPIVWMFLGAFKTNAEIFASPWALPETFRFDNIVAAWTQYNIGRSFLNTALVTAVATILSLAFSIPTAYAIERVHFVGSTVLLNIYLAAIAIPTVLGWIPLYFLLNRFGLIDNLWVLALVYAVGRIPFSVFILTSFMGSVPRELEESAAIDGLSRYGILFKIVTPLIRPGIITVAVMNILAFWGEYFMALLFLQSERNYTLGVAIDLMNKNAQYQNAWGALFAGLAIATVPVILVYATLQRYIVQGMLEGASKG